MSMPCIPKGNLHKSFTDLLESIALEETALAHFMNAEAEKIQAITESFEKGKITTQDILKVQESIAKTMRLPIKKEMLLQFKLEDILAKLDEKRCKDSGCCMDDCVCDDWYEINGDCDCDDYQGICHLPSTEFIKEVTLKIPQHKPDIHKIKKICLDAKPTCHKAIKTFEGWKAIIHGKITKEIRYITDECGQSIQEAEFEIPFCTFIKLPHCLKIKEVKVFVEDASTQIISPRKIAECIIIFVCVIPDSCD